MRADFVSIHDDMYGEGTELAFPSMSTCSAIIAVLDDRLVGVHKTMDRDPSDPRGRLTKTHLKILDAASKLIKNGGGARELYIAGWRVSAAGGAHEVASIQAALNCSDVPAYIYNYADSFKVTKNGATAYTNFGGGHKKANDVCTFAYHRGKAPPRIGIKRTTKVTIVVQNSGEYGGEAQVETIETPSDHLHELKKFTDFSRARG